MIPILYAMLRARRIQALAMLFLAAIAAVAAISGPAYLTHVNAKVTAQQLRDASAVQRSIEFSGSVSPVDDSDGSAESQLTLQLATLPHFTTVQATELPITVPAAGVLKPPVELLVDRQNACDHVTMISGRCMIGVAEVILPVKLATAFHLRPGDQMMLTTSIASKDQFSVIPSDPFHATVTGVNLVVGFRPELWAGHAPSAAPDGVTGFAEPVVGPDGFTMPATQHDLVLWLGGAHDLVFDAVTEAACGLDAVAVVAEETIGWSYHRDRDLTGFIDGTENPSLSEAPEVVLIPNGSAGAGGSVVLVQQWLHDVAAFEALAVEEQERVIGRTKQTSTELAEEVRGAASHVSRTTIEERGVEQHIFRRNTPFGIATTHGTMFIGFSCDQQRLSRMLARMAGAEDGIRDALTRYTTAVSGAYYFVPSNDAVQRAGGISLL